MAESSFSRDEKSPGADVNIAIDPQTSNVPTTANAGVSKKDSSTELICRICFGGKESGALIHACKCAGSIGYCHESCLLRWLGERGDSKCEICFTPYQQARRLRRFWQWSMPWSLCQVRLFRGLVISVILWICLYYFVVMTIPPQTFFMKQVIIYIMYSVMLILLSSTAIILKQTCQAIAGVLSEWYEANSTIMIVQAK